MEGLVLGFLSLMRVDCIIAILIGTFIGIVFGAIPGIGPVQSMAMSLPLTFYMAPLPSVMLLSSLYAGGVYGGSISAILIRTPGDVGSCATIMDGYTLAQQGMPRKALHLALVSSFIGTIIGTVILIFVCTGISSIAIRFGPAQLFSIVFFSLTIICAVSGTSLAKGWLAALAGTLIALVGSDPIFSTGRFTFDVPSLQKGLGMVPVLIGLFAISEIFVQIENMFAQRVEGIVSSIHLKKRGKDSLSFRELRGLKIVLGFGSLIGSFIGAVPGLGASAAAFLSYGVNEKVAREPEKFGKGSLEGIASAESANNAVTPAAMAPLIALGIPGSGCTAFLLGALMIQGLTPGPFFFIQQPELINSIFAGFFIIPIAMLVIGYFCLNLFAQALKIRGALLHPIVAILCIGGTYAISANWFDVNAMIVCGIIGFIFRKLEFPEAPLIIAYLLAPMLEADMRRALLLSQGDVFFFFKEPISASFIILSFAIVLFFAIKRKKAI